MAEWKTWLIIALIAYMVFWYKNPEKGKDYIDTSIDKINSVINKGEACTAQYDPVCGEDKKLYNNLCLAQKAGMKNVTLGVCV